MLLAAFRTHTFYYVFRIAYLVSFGNLDCWNLDILKADGTMANDTGHVDVTVMMCLATLVIRAMA